MKKLSIVGKGYSWENAAQDVEEGFEVWCASTIFTKLRTLNIEPTKIFQLHAASIFEPWIEQEQSRVVLMKYDARYLWAARLPSEDLVGMLGPVFSSSVAWMLGLAILRKYTEIRIHGVHMVNAYAAQRDCFFYLCGRAEEKGIKINTDPDAGVFSAPQTYGLV
jgi:hypothetical protein